MTQDVSKVNPRTINTHSQGVRHTYECKPAQHDKVQIFWTCTWVCQSPGTKSHFYPNSFTVSLNVDTLKFLFICMFVCLYTYLPVCLCVKVWGTQRIQKKEGIRSPGAGVPGVVSCLLCVVGTEVSFSGRTAVALNCWAILLSASSQYINWTTISQGFGFPYLLRVLDALQLCNF